MRPHLYLSGPLMIYISDIHPLPADRVIPSPNHGRRPTGAYARLIVLHATAGSDAGAESWMTDARSGVSAHLHFRRDGTVTRHVSDTSRAWHAGRSTWPGVDDVNDASLGWEIGNDNAGEPYTDAQYVAVAAAVEHYMAQGLARDAVVSHADVAPGRKTDPYGWDWDRMWGAVDMLGRPPVMEAEPDPIVAGPPPVEPWLQRLLGAIMSIFWRG